MKRRIRYQGATIFVATVTMLVLFRFTFPQWRDEFWEECFDIIGVLFVLYGFLLRISARGYKQQKSSQGHVLVTSGPYALVRNPMYFATFQIGMGIVITLFNYWILMVFVIIFITIYIPQMKKEETLLRECFKDQYKAYCLRTPRFFISPIKFINLPDYFYIKLSWVRSEIIPFILTVLGIFVIEAWEDSCLFGQMKFIEEPVELFFVVITFIVLIGLFRKREGDRTPKRDTLSYPGFDGHIK